MAAPTANDDSGGGYYELVNSYNPDGYFRMADPGNIADETSTGNTGTAYGGPTASTNDPIGNDSDDSLDMDGVDDYVHIPHSSAYEIDEGTISLWFNSNTIADQDALFSKDASGTAEGGHLSIYFQGGGASAQLRVRLQHTAASDSEYITTSLPSGYLNDGNWHNMTFTFGSGGMELYVDGQLEGTNAYTGGLRGDGDDTPNQEPIILGASRRSATPGDPTPSGNYFDGLLDEFALFDSALTSGQVADLWRAGGEPYELDEDSGTLTISAADGVLVNDDDGGETTTVSLVSGPENASSFELNSDGSFTYTPDANFSGTDSFVYEASNASGSSTATAYIEVHAIADAPAFFDYSHSVSLSAATSSADYPVQITFTEGVNGFAHANLQANGEDLRFYDSNGTELDYWIEEWNNGGSSTVWVNVEQSGTSSVEMYYGNATATAQSQGEAVFDFFDDFEDGTAGSLPAGWTLGPEAQDGTQPTLVNDSGNLVFYDGRNPNNGDDGDVVVHQGDWADGVVRQDFKSVAGGISDASLVFRYQDADNALAAGIHDATTAKFWYRTPGSGTGGNPWVDFETVDLSIAIPGIDLADGNWHSQEIRFYGNTVDLYIDNVFITSVDLASDPDIDGGDRPLPTSGGAGFWSQDGTREGYRDNHLVYTYDSGTGAITGTPGAINNGNSLTVDENSANGTPVGTVIAADPDGDSLTYSITAGNTGALSSLPVSHSTPLSTTPA